MKNKYPIYIKNMVCNRCISVVSSILDKYNIETEGIELGVIYLKEKDTNSIIMKIKNDLKKEGFELLSTESEKIVNQISSIIYKDVYQNRIDRKDKLLSEYISEKLNKPYSELSKLFSKIKSKTIQQFVITLKIERVKELVSYDELTISQISYELDFSSPQHLARVFKKNTGLTISEYKKNLFRKKIDTI